MTAGTGILDDVHQALTRYVVLPSPEAADATVLWIAATHAVPAWEHATRLVIKSPEKRCGKSRMLDIVEALCHNPILTVNISPAALVRSVGRDDPPTILLDEADTVFGAKVKDANEDLRGIINSGHGRGRPYIRWDASSRSLEKCPTFSMAALAGIGSMPDTIEDRAVIVTMRRRAPGETVSPFRSRRDGPALAILRDRLHEWVAARMDDLADAEPVMPLEDRAADTWESLIAVADAAGGTWPARARLAAVAMTGQSDASATVGERLLSDIRDIFEGEAMHTAAILAALHKLEESPWGDWYGHPFSPRDLAKMLAPYGVERTQVKVRGVGNKGYRREHLHDAWSRYLPATETQAGRETSETSETVQVNDGAEVSGFPSKRKPETGDPALTSEVSQVSEVSLCTSCHEPLSPVLPANGLFRHPACA